MSQSKEKIYLIGLSTSTPHTLGDLKKAVNSCLKALERNAKKYEWKYRVYGCTSIVSYTKAKAYRKEATPFDIGLSPVEVAKRAGIETLPHVHIVLYCSSGSSGLKVFVDYWKKHKLGTLESHNIKYSCIYDSGLLCGLHKSLDDLYWVIEEVEANYFYSKLVEADGKPFKFDRSNTDMIFRDIMS